MNNEKRISIIVLIYNSSLYIKETLLSIVKQKYKNMEIVLVDNGSKDSSMEIIYDIMKYYPDKHYNIVTIKDNMGAANGRNKGIYNATGDYFAFVDSDDTIKSNYCEEIMKIVNSTDVDVVTFGNNIIDENSKQVRSCLPPRTKEEAKRILGVFHRFVCRRSLIIENKIEIPQYSLAEDVYLSTYIQLYCKNIEIIQKNLYNYREYTTSTVGSGKLRKNMIETTKYLEDVLSACKFAYDNSSLLDDKVHYEYRAIKYYYLYILYPSRHLDSNVLKKHIEKARSLMFEFFPYYKKNKNIRWLSPNYISFYQRLIMKTCILLERFYLFKIFITFFNKVSPILVKR